jgi:tRNA(fMet)-specific endonuclease VapC
MGLIIDTNVLIDAENGRLDLKKLSSLSRYVNSYISVITVAELLSGVHLAKNPEIHVRRIAFVEGIISKIPSLEFTEEVARIYSELYAYELKRKNKTGANVHDLQIAATAIAHDYAILTSNLDDFKKIPGLKLEKAH